MLASSSNQRPIIGLTTYRKISHDTRTPIFGLMRTYIAAVQAAGGIPVMIPLGLAEPDLVTLAARLDGIILPGGGDIDPEIYNSKPYPAVRDIDRDRDRVELEMARQAVQLEKPLLAICRGHQVLNVALGGTMWEDLLDQMPGALDHNLPRGAPRNFLSHDVHIRPESRLHDILGSELAQVNSIHHQGIRDLAPELTVTATSPDGLVEGVEITGHPFAIGVQWHPECLVDDDPAMLALFEAFVHASSNGQHSRTPATVQDGHMLS